MKCPHCNYEPVPDGFYPTSHPGQFYQLPVEMKRKNENTWEGVSEEREDVFGCPNCGILFMNTGYST